ncbi:MAG: thiamine phosphate synthase [Halarcobacter sp.]
MTRLEIALGFKPKANSLYALCDYGTLLKKDIYLIDFVKIVKNLDVKLVQYRDKINSLESQIENLTYLKKHLDVPIIINDKLELLKYADGLHLGQEDLEEMKNEKLKVKNEELVFKLLRKKYPNKLFGLSTHNETEILHANNYDIDMIGLGAYRTTNTKAVDSLLADKLPYLAKISKHPVCAIGGVLIDEKIENVTFNVVGSALYE